MLVNKALRCLLFISLCSPFMLFAQLDNTYLRDELTLEEKDSTLFGTSISAFSYMRNTEYFNDIELGRTLFGYQFRPSLFYQPNNHIKLDLGVFLRNDFGGEVPYTQALPTFTVKLKNKNLSVLFGTLEGALSHRVIEPMFDINSAIERRIENGFQLKYDTKKEFLDIWINWESFIERGSPHKEVFTAGVSNMTSIYESDGGFSVKVPLQAMMHHHGGQITTDTSNLTMQLNAAAGLRVSQEFNQSFIKELHLDGYYTIYHESSNSGFFPVRDGNGVFINGLIRSKILDLMVSYWNASNYLAPRGTPVYNSLSIDKPGHFEKARELVFVRCMYEAPLFTNICMTARFEPVYDIKNSLLDYSYSFYLSYKKYIGITHIK
jgi:hypothetical protein